MGVAAAFAFGQNYGFWLGALRAAAVKTYTVTPQVWQRVAAPSVALKGADRKRALKELATRRHPDRRPTLATADALLLSDYVIAQHAAGKSFGELA